MKSDGDKMKLSDIAEFNPKESLKKGVMAKKVAMDKLQPFCRDISEVSLEKFLGGTKFRNGDTIMARITPCLENGKISLVNLLNDGEVGFGSTEYIVFRAKKGIVDSDYLYYLICSSKVREPAIKSMVGSSGRQRVQMDVVKNIVVDVPDIEEQRKIAGILKCLDDKIQLNKAINDNLYQQLDTIYRATYPYLPSDELPAGWNCVPLGTLCDSISIRHSFDKEKLVFLNTGDIENGHFLHSTYSLVQDMPGQAKKSIKTNDILYSEIRPINRHFAFVNFQADDYVVSTKLMVIRSREMDSHRLYHFLTTQDVINELQIEAESRSGTFPQIRFENVQRLPIIIAPPDIELQFTQILKDYYNMIDNNICENQHLVSLRDSILPKLMSGELDVSEFDI